ncbi:hypothetical protein AX16_002360 [Volvariella volvacea WC 439]|nr:hypothetical protein AX16_002360 [Volvariella volvacea WC 439]
MKFSSTFATLLAAVSSAVALTIDTPSNIVQCQPVRLNWREGSAPYYLSIIPAGQPSAQALRQFDATSDTSMTWIVDLPAGTAIGFALKDNTGTDAFTDSLTVRENSDDSCLNGGSGSASVPADGTATDSSSATSPSATAGGSESSSEGNTLATTGNHSNTSGGSSTSHSGSTSGRPTSSSSGSNSSPSTGSSNNDSNAAGRPGIVGVGLAGAIAAVSFAML